MSTSTTRFQKLESVTKTDMNRIQVNKKNEDYPKFVPEIWFFTELLWKFRLVTFAGKYSKPRIIIKPDQDCTTKMKLITEMYKTKLEQEVAKGKTSYYSFFEESDVYGKCLKLQPMQLQGGGGEKLYKLSVKFGEGAGDEEFEVFGGIKANSVYTEEELKDLLHDKVIRGSFCFSVGKGFAIGNNYGAVGVLREIKIHQVLNQEDERSEQVDNLVEAIPYSDSASGGGKKRKRHPAELSFETVEAPSRKKMTAGTSSSSSSQQTRQQQEEEDEVVCFSPDSQLLLPEEEQCSTSGTQLQQEQPAGPSFKQPHLTGSSTFRFPYHRGSK